MSNDVTLGPALKLDLNGVPFGTISGSYRVVRDTPNRTSTEDTSSRIKASPIRRLMLQATAQADPDAVYHAPALDLFNPDGIYVRIWHNGRGDPTQVTDIPTLILSEESRNWNMQGSAAQEIQLTGESDDDFFLPGE